MGSLQVEVRSERWGADGWRGGIVVPTRAGRVSLLVEVPPGAVRAAREALARGGPRELAGAAGYSPELAGFLPVLGAVGTVLRLVRRYGPKVKALVKRLGLRKVWAVLKSRGVPGLLALVKSLASAATGGIAGSGLGAWRSLPDAEAARLLGSAAVLAGAMDLPGLPAASLAAGLRTLDRAALARLGDRRARAELAQIARSPRLRAGAELAGRLCSV